MHTLRLQGKLVIFPPPFLLPSVSVEQYSFFFSPSVSLALCTSFSLSLSHTNFTMCHSRAAAVCYCAACRQAARSRPVISSHCPCAVTCTTEHGVREERGGKVEDEEEGGGQERRWMREGEESLGGMEDV